MRSELFCLYLHQNYLDFFEKIEDVVREREREREREGGGRRTEMYLVVA